MAHNVAMCFQIEKRGFIREGYWADIALVDLNNPWKVKKDNILYKCKWSPFEEITFKSKIVKTIVSGNIVWDKESLVEGNPGKRLSFER
ncbi:MAG TPA: hypothetical protein VKC90_16150, partial [Chitinophagaceae bacterium]|nr:hypothetical protein [Chitinophagaceae bacterium]